MLRSTLELILQDIFPMPLEKLTQVQILSFPSVDMMNVDRSLGFFILLVFLLNVGSITLISFSEQGLQLHRPIFLFHRTLHAYLWVCGCKRPYHVIVDDSGFLVESTTRPRVD